MNDIDFPTDSFSEATEDQCKEIAHTYKAEWRGKGGPLKLTVPATAVSLTNCFLGTLQNMGVPLLEDPYGGNVSVMACR